MSRKVTEGPAAAHIGMSVAFLRAGRCRGILGNGTPPPPHYKIGSSVLYDLDELDKWLKERRVDPAGRKAGARQGRAA